jgi:hypothetical protein
MRLTEKSPKKLWRSITQHAAAAAATASSTTLAIWNHIQKYKSQKLSYEDFIGNNVFIILGAFTKHCMRALISWISLMRVEKSPIWALGHMKQSLLSLFASWHNWLVICHHICKKQRPHGINQMHNWEFKKSFKCNWELCLFFFFFYWVQAKAYKTVFSIFFPSSFFFFSFSFSEINAVSLASWRRSDQEEFLTLLLHTHFLKDGWQIV